MVRGQMLFWFEFPSGHQRVFPFCATILISENLFLHWVSNSVNLFPWNIHSYPLPIWGHRFPKILGHSFWGTYQSSLFARHWFERLDIPLPHVTPILPHYNIMKSGFLIFSFKKWTQWGWAWGEIIYEKWLAPCLTCDMFS